MKIKLRNDGTYGDMGGVRFPVEVEGTNWFDCGFEVSGAEILRVGGTPGRWNKDEIYYWENSEVIRCD